MNGGDPREETAFAAMVYVGTAVAILLLVGLGYLFLKYGWPALVGALK